MEKQQKKSFLGNANTISLNLLTLIWFIKIGEIMNNKYQDCKRQFIQLSKSRYAEANLKDKDIQDEIILGFYHKDGGTTGEFSIKWIQLGNKFTPKVEMFNDSWSLFQGFKDLFEAMVKLDNTEITPDKFVVFLEKLGIENATETKQK